MSEANAALDVLLELQERLPRGPKREGAFAIWLVARVAWETGMLASEADRTDRRRIALLDKRLAPLAIPRPLARGLATAVNHLQEGTVAAARIALSQVVAPARETIGPEAGEAVARLARALHEARADQLSSRSRSVP
jgi:hypothetical protein